MTARSCDDSALWAAWFEAVSRDDVDAAIRDLYTQLDGAVQQRGPTCWVSGKCCNFDAYGHDLFVTGLEIAWVLQQVRATRDSSKVLPQFSPRGACHFQVDKLCGIHAVRPLGCRVFFCQSGTQQWQHELYEGFLKQLRQVHERLGLAYRYVEWRAGLKAAAGVNDV